MTKRQPSPDEVLAIIVDQYRHASQVDPEFEPDVVLSFDSTIADWRIACDLVGLERLGHALNETWGMALKQDDWEALLEPEGQRTLRALCEVIAKHALIETMPDKALLGGLCQSNRAFRAIRDVLLSLGVPRIEIRLETPLSPLLTRFRGRLLVPCINLAPGALPPIAHVGHVYRLIHGGAAIAFVVGLVLGIFKSTLVVVPLGVFALGMGLGLLPFPMFQGRIEVPGIRTLGELAECLGAQCNRQTIGEPPADASGLPAA